MLDEGNPALAVPAQRAGRAAFRLTDLFHTIASVGFWRYTPSRAMKYALCGVYSKDKGAGDEAYVFVSERGGPMTPKA
jgi:hypothetical protein